MKVTFVKDCPKCSKQAVGVSPVKGDNPRSVVFLCQNAGKCGYTFTADGGAFVPDSSALRDHFRAMTLGKVTLEKALFGEKLNPATRSLLLAHLLEYGTTMWMDGLKTGLLYGATRDESTDQDVSGGKPPDRGATGNGNPPPKQP